MKALWGYLTLYLKGFGMGTADLVPGVSGGTIALLTGIYERLVGHIGAIAQPEHLRLLRQFRLGAYFRAIGGGFLLAVGLGLLSAVFVLAPVVRYLLATYPVRVDSFFFGLMLATVGVVGRKVGRWRMGYILLGLVGCGLGLFLNFGTPIAGGDSYLAFFCAGLVGVCAMILPGISGSFILILLGMYTRVLQLVVTVDIPHLAVFALGAVLGLLSFSRLLSWLFARFEGGMLAILTGFILGAMVRLWPWKVTEGGDGYSLQLLTPEGYSQTHGAAHIGWAVLFFLLGFTVVSLLEWGGRRKTVR